MLNTMRTQFVTYTALLVSVFSLTGTVGMSAFTKVAFLVLQLTCARAAGTLGPLLPVVFRMERSVMFSELLCTTMDQVQCHAYDLVLKKVAHRELQQP